MSLIYKLVKRTNISLDKGTGHKQVIHRKKKKPSIPFIKEMQTKPRLYSLLIKMANETIQ